MAAPTRGEMPAWLLRPISDMPVLGPADSLSGVQKELQELLDRYSKGIESANLSEVEACMRTDEEFVIVESTYPNYGWDDYYQNHLSLELGAIDDVEYSAKLVHAYGNDNLSYGVFTYHAAGSRDGNRRSVEGMGTLVAERMNGEWRIRHWATCSRKPLSH